MRSACSRERQHSEQRQGSAGVFAPIGTNRTGVGRAVYTARMTLEQWAQLGTAAGGFAAAGGVVFAWFGYRAWRSQKRADQASDAAVRVLALLTRGAEALTLMSRPLTARSVPGSEAERKALAGTVRKTYQEREERYRKDLDALDEAASIAGLFLDEHHRRVCYGIQCYRRMLHIAAYTYAMQLDGGNAAEGADEHDRAFSVETRQQVRSILESARGLLLPVARYHSNPLLSSIWAVQKGRVAKWLEQRRAARQVTRRQRPRETR